MRSKRKLSFFVDNKLLLQQGDFGLDPVGDYGAFAIGCSHPVPVRGSMKGSLDELVIFDRELPEHELRAIYEMGMHNECLLNEPLGSHPVELDVDSE